MSDNKNPLDKEYQGVYNINKKVGDNMNNEEILSQILENQKQMQQQIFENQKKTDERLDEHYNMIYQLLLNQEKMQKDIKSTQDDVKSIKLEIENVISPSIQTLCSMQIDNSKRINKLENEVRDLKDELAVGEVVYNLKHNKMI